MQQLQSWTSIRDKNSRNAILTVCSPYEAQISLPNMKRHNLLEEE
jgi:hypothetical protein